MNKAAEEQKKALEERSARMQKEMEKKNEDFKQDMARWSDNLKKIFGLDKETPEQARQRQKWKDDWLKSLEPQPGDENRIPPAPKYCSSCCLPGTYGTDNLNCQPCPANKPATSWANPGPGCKCPNLTINNCFACTNKCRPYNGEGSCMPFPCFSGYACKIVKKQPTCV